MGVLLPYVVAPVAVSLIFSKVFADGAGADGAADRAGADTVNSSTGAEVLERTDGTLLDLHTPFGSYQDLRLALVGEHQARNAALTGSVGDYVQFQNRGFTPFTWPYQALAEWQQWAGTAPVLQRIEAQQQFDQGGLAPAVLADDEYDLALGDGQIDRSEGEGLAAVDCREGVIHITQFKLAERRRGGVLDGYSEHPLLPRGRDRSTAPARRPSAARGSPAMDFDRSSAVTPAPTGASGPGRSRGCASISIILERTARRLRRGTRRTTAGDQPGDSEAEQREQRAHDERADQQLARETGSTSRSRLRDIERDEAPGQ